MAMRRGNRSFTNLVLTPTFLLVAILVIAAAPNPRAAGDPADSAMQSIRPESIRAEMRFLSDDLLEGRGTGARRLMRARPSILVRNCEAIILSRKLRPTSLRLRLRAKRGFRW